jgi:soluble lytic murein transglycosylase-like protein
MMLLAVGWILGQAGVADARGLYRYIDEKGVLHFSDTPVDGRYHRVKRDVQEGIAISPRPHVRVPAERDYDRLIAKIGTRYQVHPGLVKAVIAAESNFQPDAVSRVGAQGLMQLMPATAAELGVDRPFGVVENIDGGVRYLRMLIDRYGDLTRSLAAYNAGPTAVDRYRGVPPYRETQAYVKRVLEYYRVYRRDFDRAFMSAQRAREVGPVAIADTAAQANRQKADW